MGVGCVVSFWYLFELLLNISKAKFRNADTVQNKFGQQTIDQSYPEVCIPCKVQDPSHYQHFCRGS